MDFSPTKNCFVGGVLSTLSVEGCRLVIGASLVAQMVKHLPANAGDPGSIPGLGRSPGEGNGNPLQYSCLENSMARGAAKSQTQLSDFTFQMHG